VGYLARYVNAVKRDQDKVISKRTVSLNYKERTDYPQHKNTSEKDETEIDISPTIPHNENVTDKNEDKPANHPPPLIPLEENGPIATAEFGVINTAQVKLDGDIPDADDSLTQPNSDSQSSSPFAKLVMFNRQNLKSGTKSELMMSDKGTQGELINFLLKSGLF
jgi:hypothetical protein